METVTKPGLRATDRLGQTVTTLARLLDQTMNEIQVLDSDFQEQLEATDQNARLVVNTEWEDRFNKELAKFEATRTELITERNQLSRQLEQLKDASAEQEEARTQLLAEWEEERARLVAECERTSQLVDQGKKEYDRALAATDEAAALALERQVANAVERVRGDLTAKWDAERAKLVNERNRAQQRLADAVADYEGQVEESVNEVRTQLTKEMDALRRELEEARRSAAAAASKPAPVSGAAVDESILAEIARVEGSIQAISKIVEDPDTELSIVIRKNVERAELESYLRGLRFKSTGN
jgi:DNA repair exonuclease SbcCD ATPase subunit